ncbi:uncharacterized protein LOC141596582 [Silene latifolia]|uniref:uncharacterized protein LOC141596582 n=1 Tax=Silene latifolia TaxID=37657 RepID=UPI003D7802AC
MNIASIYPKSSKFLRLLKPYTKLHSSFLHLATEKPNNHFPSSITQIIDFLKSNDKQTWSTNDQLSQSISSLSSDNFLQLVRSLDSYSIGFDFIEHLRSMPKNPDEKSLSFAFQAVFELASRETGGDNKVLEVYEKAMEWGVSLSVNSVTHLMRCLSRYGMVDKLMMIYAELEPQMRNVHVCNVMIDGLVRNQRLDDALQVLDEMLEPNSKVLPDGNTMEIVFSALFRGKECGRCVSEKENLEMVAKFGRRGLFFDSISLTKWISRLCKMRRINTAWGMLKTVMELGGPVEVPSCNALLTGLNKAREFDKMNCLMKEMQEKGIHPNIVTLGISINHLCKSMRVDKAMDLFEKIRRGEINADIKPDVVIYNNLIDGLCKVGRIEEGLAMMRRMRSESECSPGTITFNCLIDRFCKEGEIDRALELFEEMAKEEVEPSIVTVNILVSGFCRHGRAGDALEFYRKMQEEGLDGNAKTYTTLISGFCGVNNVREAMELLAEMKGQCSPDAIVYYTLISGLSRAGLMNEVETILLEMKSAGFFPDIGCYNVMINGFCQTNQVDKAHQLLKDMETDGIKPDSITYNTLISYFSKIGDLKTSSTILRQMIKENIVPTVVTYGILIHSFCSRGELNEAMKIFREAKCFRTTTPNTVIYNTLIHCHCQNNMVEDALLLLDDMLGKGVKPNANTFNALFKALREKNRLEKAFELMDRMTEQGCSPDNITLKVLTQWLSGVGETEKLRRFVEGDNASSSGQES